MTEQTAQPDDSMNLVEACRLATYRHIGLSGSTIREIAIRHCPPTGARQDIYRVAVNGEPIERVAYTMGLDLAMLRERYKDFLNYYISQYAFGTRPHISTGPDPMLGTPSFDTETYGIGRLSSEERAELCQLVPADAIDFRRHEMTRLVYVEGMTLAAVARIVDRSHTNVRQHIDRYLRQALRWVDAIMVDRNACAVPDPRDAEQVRERFHQAEREYLAEALKIILRSRYTHTKHN